MALKSKQFRINAEIVNKTKSEMIRRGVRQKPIPKGRIVISRNFRGISIKQEISNAEIKTAYKNALNKNAT